MNGYSHFLEYEREIKLFYNFLVEHGPKSVDNKVIFLEFLQRVLNEGALIFIKNLKQEIDIQKSVSDEFQHKYEKELKKVKEDLTLERNQLLARNAALEQVIYFFLINKKHLKLNFYYIFKIKNYLFIKKDLI